VTESVTSRDLSCFTWLYMIHNGTLETLALQSLHGGSNEITLEVSLNTFVFLGWSSKR